MASCVNERSGTPEKTQIEPCAGPPALRAVASCLGMEEVFMTSVVSVSSSRNLPPGPRAWPLIGNVGVLRGLIPFMEQQWAEHGDVFRMRMGNMRAVAVVHPDTIQHVLLTKRQNYVKGPVLDSLRQVLGDGLITLEGDAWKSRRTLAQPAFHRRSLEKLTTIMVRSGARYFDGLTARLDAPHGEIDAHREMVKLTLDVVISALFGEGTIDGSSISYETLGSALELVSEGTNGFRLPDWLPTPHNLKFRRTMRELDGSVHEVIDNARKLAHGNGSLLSMLLDARDEDGKELGRAALRNEVMTLFLAGHETTALTLTWMFAMLDGQPEILARMQSEVDEVLHGRDPTFDDFAKLTYVRQVVDETLRVRPPAPMVARNAVEDDVLGGYEVRAGEVVLPFFWGVHRHPDYWHEPARFDPDRFSAAQSKGRNSWCYLPFSAGPRVCIGNMFSLIETVTLVAQLLNRFEVQVLSCADIKPVAVGTVRPSRPVRVRLRRR